MASFKDLKGEIDEKEAQARAQEKEQQDRVKAMQDEQKRAKEALDKRTSTLLDQVYKPTLGKMVAELGLKVVDYSPCSTQTGIYEHSGLSFDPQENRVGIKATLGPGRGSISHTLAGPHVLIFKRPPASRPQAPNVGVLLGYQGNGDEGHVKLYAISLKQALHLESSQAKTFTVTTLTEEDIAKLRADLEDALVEVMRSLMAGG